MEYKVKRSFSLKIICLVLCFFIAITPFFQPKRVEASPMLLLGISAVLITGMIAGGYARDTILTPEQINNANDYCTANLQAAFPDPAEYNKQLTTLQNLDNDIRAGKDIDWSKYSGKALYAVLKGVVDVVWPETYTIPEGLTFIAGFGDISVFYYRSAYGDQNENVPLTGYNSKMALSSQPWDIYFTDASVIASGKWGNFCDNWYGFYLYQGSRQVRKVNINRDQSTLPSGYHIFIHRPGGGGSGQDYDRYIAAAIGIPEYNINNSVYVPNITTKTANKVKLPTRLSQTVINNINNYIDNSTENLIIAPTDDELPTLPDNYNPNTDELPDLPGYQDITPDQEPTTDPEPTPTTPDPTPTPEPTPPEYNGDEWVNPIGNFFDGLLKFMKAAFVPTLSLDLSALSNMPENFTDKFPFSLPSDIVSIFGVINADPVAPSFSFTFPLSYVGGEDMDASFNLDAFNDAAAVIRSLLLLVVVVLLAWKTYGLVGGDS